jgi:cytochrome c oxidase assembly protein subunit 15
VLHRFSKFVVACTVLLILAGSLVTSHDAGLSVPDWPTTYGWNMFTFPPSMWVANILYEHGHRLIATGVGMLTIVLAAWLWYDERGSWVRWMGVVALGAIVAQGVLGGITVLLLLPPAVSTAHAALAEIFFCITVAIAVFTSKAWRQAYGDPDDDRHATPDDGSLRRLATTTTVLVYVQILIGATMRHTGAGLAIPDFPLMFGGIVPDHWSAAIAIHFAHRVGALVVFASIVTTAVYVLRHHTDRSELAQPALATTLLTIAQIVLGAMTVITKRDPLVNSLHVVVGAFVLTMSLVLTLRSWRAKIPVGTVRLKPDTPYDRDGLGSDVRNVRLQPDHVRLQADPRGPA